MRFGTGRGDTNDDGQRDFLLSASMYSIDPGTVYLFSTPPTSDTTAGAADATLEGIRDLDNAGSALAGAGDTNGDGFDDLLIGAYTEDSALPDAGCVYHLLGPVSGSHSLADADHTIGGIQNSQELGFPRSLCQGDDLNGDGYSDLALGSPYFDGGQDSTGGVFILLGPIDASDSLSNAEATLSGEANNDQAGSSVAILGDVSGDGTPDLLVGAPWEDTSSSSSGAAYLVLGPFEGHRSLAEADAKLLGEEQYDYAGFAVATAGDVDADGVPDMLVGAFGAPAAYLVLGPGY